MCSLQKNFNQFVLYYGFNLISFCLANQLEFVPGAISPPGAVTYEVIVQSNEIVGLTGLNLLRNLVPLHDIDNIILCCSFKLQ